VKRREAGNQVNGLLLCGHRPDQRQSATPQRPSATSNFRRPMVTVIRPSRARCDLLVGGFSRQIQVRPIFVGVLPLGDLCFGVDETPTDQEGSRFLYG